MEGGVLGQSILSFGSWLLTLTPSFSITPHLFLKWLLRQFFFLFLTSNYVLFKGRFFSLGHSFLYFEIYVKLAILNSCQYIIRNFYITSKKNQSNICKLITFNDPIKAFFFEWEIHFFKLNTHDKDLKQHFIYIEKRV